MVTRGRRCAQQQHPREHHAAHDRAHRARRRARVRRGEPPVLGAQGVPLAGAAVGARWTQTLSSWRRVRWRSDSAARSSPCRVSDGASDGSWPCSSSPCSRATSRSSPRSAPFRSRFRARTRHPTVVPAAARGARGLGDRRASALKAAGEFLLSGCADAHTLRGYRYHYPDFSHGSQRHHALAGLAHRARAPHRRRYRRPARLRRGLMDGVTAVIGASAVTPSSEPSPKTSRAPVTAPMRSTSAMRQPGQGVVTLAPVAEFCVVVSIPPKGMSIGDA